jgi:hypothetical protein
MAVSCSSPVERGVNGAEAQDLGFGAAGGGAAEAPRLAPRQAGTGGAGGTELAQGGIAIPPKLAGRVITTEEDFGCGGCPVERAAQFAGDSRYGACAEVSALGEAVVALHPGPEAAVGKAVMGFGVVETLGQLTLGDMGDEADMRSCGLQVLLHIEGGEITAIPGAAEQWRELCLATFQRIEDGSELLREREETTVGGRLLIA